LASLDGLATQIVVVDTQSTDRTLVIAQRYGALISSPPDWPGFGPQKNRALDLASEDWVLSLDADERLTPELRAEIMGVLYKPQTDCYAIPRLSWYCGRFMRHSGWTPDYVDRLFKRGSARFSSDLVHERLIPKGPVLRHSTASAQQAFAKGKTASPLKAILHGAWSFFRTYILRAGFLDGPQGFSLAYSNAQGTYLRYMKLWRLNQTKVAIKK